MQTIKKSWLITGLMLLFLLVAPVAMVAAEDAVEDGHSAETSDEHGADAEHGTDGEHSADAEPIVAEVMNAAGADSSGTWVVLSLLALILVLLAVVAVIGAVSLGIIGIGFAFVSEDDG